MHASFEAPKNSADNRQKTGDNNPFVTDYLRLGFTADQPGARGPDIEIYHPRVSVILRGKLGFVLEELRRPRPYLNRAEIDATPPQSPQIQIARLAMRSELPL